MAGMNPVRAALTTLAFTVAATLAAPVTAHAAVPVPAGLMHWPSRTVHVHDGTHDPLVAEAVRDWDRLGVIRVTEQLEPCATGEACIEVGPAALPDHIGGVTPTRYDAARVILSARVELNTAYPVGVKVGWDGIPASWALNVRVHELGHALGLVHSPEGTCSVMAPTACGTPDPTAYDAWMLAEAYRLP